MTKADKLREADKAYEDERRAIYFGFVRHLEEAHANFHGELTMLDSRYRETLRKIYANSQETK